MSSCAMKYSEGVEMSPLEPTESNGYYHKCIILFRTKTKRRKGSSMQENNLPGYVYEWRLSNTHTVRRHGSQTHTVETTHSCSPKDERLKQGNNPSHTQTIRGHQNESITSFSVCSCTSWNKPMIGVCVCVCHTGEALPVPCPDTWVYSQILDCWKVQEPTGRVDPRPHIYTHTRTHTVNKVHTR